MMRKSLIFLLQMVACHTNAVLILFFLGGCSQIQGPYDPPTVNVPENWKNETDESTPELYHWWVMFDDPILDDLENFAIQNNKTVAIAYQKMSQAYFQARFRFGALLPVATLDPNFFKQGSRTGAAAGLNGGGLNGIPSPVGAGSSNGASVPGCCMPIIPPKRTIITNIEVPLNFSWELDLWGRLTQNYLNAYFTFQSTHFDSQQTLNQLTSDVAVNYFMLRGFDTEIEILDKIINSRQDNLDINKERFKAGLINYIDVTRAEVDLNSAKAEKENVIRERELQENILAILIGIPASELEVAYNPLPLDLSPPIIPAGIPCELLFRRPDVLSRERLVAALHANIGVAYADFFPDLTISGAIGFSSNQWSNLFDWQSRLWQMAASITQIIYNGGRLEANLYQTVAAYWESVSQYEESVLNAFKDVEDALVNTRQRERQEIDLQLTVVAAQETYDLAISRYNSGLINYLDVVIAERDLLNSSRTAASVHSQRFVDTALLVKGLGGGW